MRIGPYELGSALALAPMAGVTDLPFRRLCRRMGAGIAASEMVTSDVRLWRTDKTRHRLDHRDEPEPRVVQIAGDDPAMMAEAARMNADLGAQVIDINLGCPAKKVCNRAAGSALMRDEPLVATCEAVGGMISRRWSAAKIPDSAFGASGLASNPERSSPARTKRAMLSQRSE